MKFKSNSFSESVLMQTLDRRASNTLWYCAIVQQRMHECRMNFIFRKKRRSKQNNVTTLTGYGLAPYMLLSVYTIFLRQICTAKMLSLTVDRCACVLFVCFIYIYIHINSTIVSTQLSECLHIVKCTIIQFSFHLNVNV